MTFTHALATNNYGTAKFIVSSSAANGTHTTIASALTAASSGDTIFIRDGSYTEDLTLKAGVNLAAFSGGEDTPNVTIIGNATFTAAGTVAISNIRLQTNGAAFLTVSGSAASVVDLLNCYVNCTNATGISHSSSSSSSIITLLNCNGDIGTTGISLIASTSAGSVRLRYTRITNSGNSVTASTTTAGGISINTCVLSLVFTSSSTGSIDVQFSQLASSNTTIFTFNGTTAADQVENSVMNSGTASAISIGAGATGSVRNCRITSTNTNAITGAGTLVSANNIFPNSVAVNTTTQTPNSFGPTNINANQPAFLVNLASTDTNVTGNNTLYTVGTNTAYTEIYDQAGNFSGTTFTAPVTGKYYLSATATFTGIGTATSFELAIATSNRSYFVIQSGIASPTGNYSLTRSVLADMDVGDTATMQVRVNGAGADTVDLLGTSANFTNFSGFLAC